MYFKNYISVLLILTVISNCGFVYATEAQETITNISIGIGWEKLSYTEKIPEFSIVASNTELNNLVLYFDVSKKFYNYFLGVKGILPVVYGNSTEYWEKARKYAQSNSLTYKRTKLDAYLGYTISHLFNPYIGTSWSYSHQGRNNFQTANSQGISKISVTEKVNSLFLLLGCQGKIPINTKWSFAYFLEYLLPYYSKVENSSLVGWEPSNIDGYSYSLTGQLEYLFTAKTALVIQVAGGKLYWDGTDWERVGNSLVKWPENETVFVGGYINFKKYF